MKKMVALILILLSGNALAGQEASARAYAETVTTYMNIWIKKNYPDNPVFSTPDQFIASGINWYQAGVKLRHLDDNAKNVRESLKRKSSLSGITETCTDSTIDNTASLGSIVATKAIIKACINTAMDGYDNGE